MRYLTILLLTLLAGAAQAQLVIGTNTWWVQFTFAPAGPQPAVGAELDQAWYPAPLTVTTKAECDVWKQDESFWLLRPRWDNRAASVNASCVEAQPLQPPA